MNLKISLLLAASLLIFHSGIAAEIVFAAYADSHGNVENLRKMHRVIRQLRSQSPKHFLLIDAGDTLQGTWECAADGARTMQSLHRELGTQIWVPGNHDFEAPPERFREFSGTLLGADWQLGDFVPRSWELREFAGFRIALIGLGERNNRTRLLPDTLIRFQNQRTALRKIMPEVRRSNPHAIILIRHDGLYQKDSNLKDFLRDFPEIDLVIGAHTHQAISGKMIGKSWFVQPGKYGEQLAEIRLEFEDDSRKLLRITSKLHPVSSVEPLPFSPDMEQRLSEIALAGKEPVRIEQNVAKAMQLAAGSDAALYPGARLRLPDMTTEWALFQALPFHDQIAVVELTAEELHRIMDAETEKLKTYTRRRLQLYPETLPEKTLLRVAVSDYHLAGYGGTATTLHDAIVKQNKKYRRTGISLRQAVRSAAQITATSAQQAQ